jgi:hypothetical protein
MTLRPISGASPSPPLRPTGLAAGLALFATLVMTTSSCMIFQISNAVSVRASGLTVLDAVGGQLDDLERVHRHGRPLAGRDLIGPARNVDFLKLQRLGLVFGRANGRHCGREKVVGGKQASAQNFVSRSDASKAPEGLCQCRCSAAPLVGRCCVAKDRMLQGEGTERDTGVVQEVQAQIAPDESAARRDGHALAVLQ